MKSGLILFGTFAVLFCIIKKIKGIHFDGRAIVNGFNKPVEPKQGEFPYQATLLAHINGTYLIFCGGSLIHPRWILTAAHCLEQDGTTRLSGYNPTKNINVKKVSQVQYKNYAFLWALPQKEWRSKGLPSSIQNSNMYEILKAFVKIAVGSVYSNLRKAQVLDVKEIFSHKEYLVSEGTNDIGLLKISRSLTISKFVNLVKLHTNVNEKLIGQTAYLTGFGITNDFQQKPKRLRKARLHVNTPDRCQIDQNDTALLVCCTSTIGEGKACKGDSGGPLVIIKNGSIYQIGITSHLAILPFCKITFNHSVYTKVSSYISWISAITGIDFYKYNTAQ